MELTLAAVVAALGVLFGLNFIGLFVAAYVFDRSAKHILFYLAAVLAFIVSGVGYLLAIMTPYTRPFLVVDDIFQALGLILVAYGLARAFSIPLPKRFLAPAYGAGVILTIALSGLGETSIIRLIAVSLWQVSVPALIVILLLRPRGGAMFERRFLACLVALAVAAIAARPLIFASIEAGTDLSHADQVTLYGAVATTALLIALFGVGAGIFFQVMSDLANGYRNASLTDGMTGLMNRRGFLDAAERLAVRPQSLIMLDIDRFKSVNDVYGHNIGDRVIMQIAAILKHHVERPHLAGRLGGEEFAILLHRTEIGTAAALAHALRGAIEVALDGYLEDERRVTASFGVAEVAEDGIAGAMVDADRALYQAKRTGRNRVCIGSGHEPLRPSRIGGHRAAS